MRNEGEFLLKQKSSFNKEVFALEKTTHNFEFRTLHFELVRPHFSYSPKKLIKRRMCQWLKKATETKVLPPLRVLTE